VDALRLLENAYSSISSEFDFLRSSAFSNAERVRICAKDAAHSFILYDVGLIEE
jgi:hypothetical protein